MHRFIRARALPALLVFALSGMPLGAQEAAPQPGVAQTTQYDTGDRDRGFDWGLLGLLGLLGLMGMRGRNDTRHDTTTTTRRV